MATNGQPSESSLAKGATTLVMRSTHLKLTSPEIMTLLNVLTVALGYKIPMYDFVYMPWAKLAIVNFVDHASCKAYFDKIQEVCCLGTEHPAIRNVTQAYIQGLSQNLAFFLAKSGQQAIFQPHAPMVFQQGVQMPIQQAVERHVSMELLASMQHMHGKGQGKGQEDQGATLGWQEYQMPTRNEGQSSALNGIGATSGWHGYEMSRRNAGQSPALSDTGVQMPIQQAVERHVSMELLASMQHMHGKGQGKGQEDQGATSGWHGYQMSTRNAGQSPALSDTGSLFIRPDEVPFIQVRSTPGEPDLTVYTL